MDAQPLPNIDVEAAAASTDSVLLDVREFQEWMAGRSSAAVHIPMAEIVDRVDEIDRSQRIICVCRSGNRSSRVTQWLREQGFDAVNMTGGMNAWASAQLPMVNHAGNPGVVI
jgi:rhodanese-related sulfurtransferase